MQGVATSPRGRGVKTPVPQLRAPLRRGQGNKRTEGATKRWLGGDGNGAFAYRRASRDWSWWVSFLWACGLRSLSGGHGLRRTDESEVILGLVDRLTLSTLRSQGEKTRHEGKDGHNAGLFDSTTLLMYACGGRRSPFTRPSPNPIS